jgi:hypothetical protein
MRGIHGVSVLPADPYATAGMLETLALPDRFEADRALVEDQLPALSVPGEGDE